VRPFDDVLGALFVAESTTKIFYGETNHRDHELLFTGQGKVARAATAGGGGSTGWPLAFFNSYLFTVYISIKSS
jgi:hypothetical protein